MALNRALQKCSLSKTVQRSIQHRELQTASLMCQEQNSNRKDSYSKAQFVSPIFVNRNPRNLEMMAIAHKRRGWRFQAPRTDFYHKLIFEKGKFTSAKLVHTSGETIIKASAKEHAISQLLTSTSDSTAAYNIGRVIAHRCILAGIECALFDPTIAGEQVEQFKQGVIDCGMDISEPEETPFGPQHIGINYDKIDGYSS